MRWDRRWIFVTWFLWCGRVNMERTVEQRYAVKFCFDLGKSKSETFELFRQAYKDDVLSRTRGFEWHNIFKEGWELVEVLRRIPGDRSNRCSGGHLTSSCFREWKESSKDIDSTPSRRFKRRRQRLSTVFRKPTSSGILTSGRLAELSVSMQVECILKIIK